MFHELDELDRIAGAAGTEMEVRTLCEVACGSVRLPVRAMVLGSADSTHPALGIFGGVHGLERIGTQLAIAMLQSIVARLRWDASLRFQLQQMRLVFVPLVNPGGMLRRTRANPNGVDLMRNAPLDSAEKVPALVGGHRIGPWLPWYRGPLGAEMEVESAALCRIVEEELLRHRFSAAVDCHSGFGVTDRIWFPHAHTASPIAHLPELHALCEVLDESHGHHRYVFEPQSRQYLAHGDLWDHLYLKSLRNGERVFLPLTLEMGSWLWIKKNPRQVFSRHGIFNPLIEHRRQRVLRRHTAWLDFMIRATVSHASWLPASSQRERHLRHALARWYGGGAP